jgi:hypothetical protein
MLESEGVGGCEVAAINIVRDFKKLERNFDLRTLSEYHFCTGD